MQKMVGERFLAGERSCANALKQKNLLCLRNWGRIYGDKQCRGEEYAELGRD